MIVNLNEYRRRKVEQENEEKIEEIEQKKSMYSGNNKTKNIEEVKSKRRSPYMLIKLLKAQNRFARRGFTPRVDIRISAFNPNGMSAVKIRL